MTQEEHDKDMIESIEMWLHEIEPKWVKKEFAWLDELRNRLLEEDTPNDLEEAAKKYATEWHENPDGSAWKPYFEVSAIKAFIAGAEWKKEQMLKEAVAVEVVGDKRDLRLIDSTQRCLFNANRGDWLNIIIVKEDEK